MRPKKTPPLEAKVSKNIVTYKGLQQHTEYTQKHFNSKYTYSLHFLMIAFSWMALK